MGNFSFPFFFFFFLLNKIATAAAANRMCDHNSLMKRRLSSLQNLGSQQPNEWKDVF